MNLLYGLEYKADYLTVILKLPKTIRVSMMISERKIFRNLVYNSQIHLFCCQTTLTSPQLLIWYSWPSFNGSTANRYMFKWGRRCLCVSVSLEWPCISPSARTRKRRTFNVLRYFTVEIDFFCVLCMAVRKSLSYGLGYSIACASGPEEEAKHTVCFQRAQVNILHTSIRAIQTERMPQV